MFFISFHMFNQLLTIGKTPSKMDFIAQLEEDIGYGDLFKIKYFNICH